MDRCCRASLRAGVQTYPRRFVWLCGTGAGASDARRGGGARDVDGMAQRRGNEMPAAAPSRTSLLAPANACTASMKVFSVAVALLCLTVPLGA